jgi:hypothetical protein
MRRVSWSTCQHLPVAVSCLRYAAPPSLASRTRGVTWGVDEHELGEVEMHAVRETVAPSEIA